MTWPPRAGDSYRERFVALMRQTLQRCECTEVLQELGAVPSAPAAAAKPSASRVEANVPAQH
jgi:hypothetical protein